MSDGPEEPADYELAIRVVRPDGRAVFELSAPVDSPAARKAFLEVHENLRFGAVEYNAASPTVDPDGAVISELYVLPPGLASEVLVRTVPRDGRPPRSTGLRVPPVDAETL
jgi:hypothetical protein